MESIYLDFNATTPLHRQVARDMAQWVTQDVPANPSSLHQHGREARRLLENSREELARYLQVDAAEVHFTSGGTESNNLALLGISPVDSPLLVGATEHPSILEPAKKQWKSGRPGGLLAVDDRGKIVDFEVSPGALYSIQWYNNETGVAQDIAALSRHIHDGGGLLHVDGAQGFFRDTTPISSLGIDAATITGHKSFGPVGAGALWVRSGLLIDPVIVGGPQEKKIRPGTENLLAIRGLGALAQIAGQQPLWDLATLREHRGQLIESLQPIANTRIIEHGDEDWPGCIHVSFLDVHAETLLVRLDMEGISASSGSACSSGAREPSHVLKAMNSDQQWIRGAIRLSIGPQIDSSHIATVGEKLNSIVGELRSRDLSANA